MYLSPYFKSKTCANGDKMLYGLPVGSSKLADLADMADVLEAHQGSLRLLVDHAQQVQALTEYNRVNNRQSPWSVFVKVETGGK